MKVLLHLSILPSYFLNLYWIIIFLLCPLTEFHSKLAKQILFQLLSNVLLAVVTFVLICRYHEWILKVLISFHSKFIFTFTIQTIILLQHPRKRNSTYNVYLNQSLLSAGSLRWVIWTIVRNLKQLGIFLSQALQ